jgi:hypothetical protein
MAGADMPLVFRHVQPNGQVSRATLLVMTEAEWKETPESASPIWDACIRGGIVYALAIGSPRIKSGSPESGPIVVFDRSAN